mmetsp:Transcript_32165/g.61893  ORF Transcript_32165/g.61893 Transcript_32165/m.61893 type:complete len:452 (-) Transcript_32165:216-1571(-)
MLHSDGSEILYHCSLFQALHNVDGSRVFPEGRIRGLLQSSNGSHADDSPWSPPFPPGFISNETAEMSAQMAWTARQAAARLNLADRQRMYSQKLTKDALLIHLGLNVDTSLWQLEETRKKFQLVNQALLHGSEKRLIRPATEPEIIVQLKVIQELWGPFHEILKNTVQRGNITMDEILTVVSIEETLLKELSTMVDMVEKINIEEGSAIIAEQSVEYAMHMSAIYHAGAQRMRTQKLIVKYAMCVANLDFNKSLASLQATVDDFHQVHQGLIFGSDDLFLPPATNPYAIYWMGQVTDLWEGRKGFHATVEKEPSMYRLPELVAANIPLLGRCNLVVGLIEKTAASPPSPMTPPSYPSFPPIVRKPDSMDELTPVMIYLAVAVGVLSLFTIAYHRCYRRYRKAGAKVNEEVQNAFTAKLKADKKAPKDPPKQVPEGGSNPGDGAAGVSSMPP